MTVTRHHAVPGGLGLLGTALALRAGAAGDGLAAARASVRMGCEATYPPFSVRRGETFVGCEVDVATLRFKPIGVVPRSSARSGPAASRRCMRIASTSA